MNSRPAEEPYVGPRAFERQDRHRFFAREYEANDLLSLVTAHQVVLLYARSGAGKSSLLNAKLVPMLEEDGFEVLPTARVYGKGSEVALLTPLMNIYLFNVLGYLRKEAIPESLVGSSLLDHLLSGRAPAGKLCSRVLIIDQFEELFTTGPWEHRRPFVELLGQALEIDKTLRIILAMREDYIAELASFAELLPERLRTQFRLEPLREPAAVIAARRPLEAIGGRFAPGVAESLVASLLAVKGAPRDEAAREEFVEPVQLQVICQSLWRSVRDLEVPEITPEHLIRFGDVDQVLRQYYEETIRRVATAAGVREGVLRRWFENVLITRFGTRASVWRGGHDTVGLPNRAVDELEVDRLIAAEVRRGIQWYELAHERLIDVVRSSNAAWRSTLSAYDETRQFLEARAAEWIDADRSTDRLLTGEDLDRAEAWISSPHGEDLGITESVRAFVSSSRAFEEGRHDARRRWGTRTARRAVLWRVAIGGLLIALLILSPGSPTVRREALGARALATRDLDLALQALEQSRRAGDRSGELEALTAAGAARERLGQRTEALRSYEAVLRLGDGALSSTRRAQLLTQIGSLRLHLGDAPGALAALLPALDLSRRIGDQDSEATLLLAAGEARIELGHSREALAAFDRADRMARQLDDSRLRAAAARLGGLTRLATGDVEGAFLSLRQSLDAARRTASPEAESWTLLALAEAHLRLGAGAEALDELAAARRPPQADLPAAARWLRMEGQALEFLGRTEAATAVYLRGLTLLTSKEDAPAEEARLLAGLSRTLPVGHAETTYRLLTGRLAILARGSTVRREVLLTLADLAARRSRADLAARYLDEALSLARSCGDRWTEMDALVRKIRLAQGPTPAALGWGRDLVAIGEWLRQGLVRRDLGLLLSARLDESYGVVVDMLLRFDALEPQGGYAAQAFEIQEARQAATLLRELDRLATSTPAPALVERQRELLLRLSEPSFPIPATTDSASAAQSSAWARVERALLLGEYWRNRAEMMRVAGDTRPRLRPSVETVQRRLLDSETTLLEYSLGEAESWLFAVSEGDFRVYRLAGKGEINQAVGAFLAQVQNARTLPGQTDRAAAVLSKMLLPPTASVQGRKRIAVVADGPVGRVPFAALPDPSAPVRAGARPALLAEHEIVYLPSAAFLAHRRQQVERRAAPPERLAVLADPVLASSDPRLPSRPADPGDGDNAPAGFQREAAVILSLPPRDRDLDARGFAARRELFLDGTLSRYRILHLAVPANIDQARADESRLMLSAFDEHGRPRDGMVRGYELLELYLPCELVVLSSGETALGRPVPGEGFAGLSQAFLGAGAVRVVDTLWTVQDLLAAELMIRFHRHLRAGETAAAALRSAQLEVSGSDRRSSALGWAAFRLVGDWQ